LGGIDDYPKSHYLSGQPFFLNLPATTEKTKKEGRLELRVDPDWLEILDDLRRQEKDVPTRAEYLRRLATREYMRLNSQAA